MKPTTKFKLYKSWITAVVFLPVVVLFIPVLIATPFEWLFRKLGLWIDKRISKKMTELRVGYFYKPTSKEPVLMEISDEPEDDDEEGGES